MNSSLPRDTNLESVPLVNMATALQLAIVDVMLAILWVICSTIYTTHRLSLYLTGMKRKSLGE